GSVKDTEYGKLLVRPRDAGGVTMSVYVVVADADAHFVRAKAAGAVITREPVTQEYVGRHYTAKDPEGNGGTVGHYHTAAGHSSIARRSGHRFGAGNATNAWNLKRILVRSLERPLQFDRDAL